MAKIMLHDAAARQALGRGVAQLARAVRGTLGPRGMNAIIDRPIGTPIISRDGVSIAAEVELEDPFENMGAQVAREVSMKTNEVVGDGTTTATILADAMVQQGLAALDAGANPVELVRGLEQAVEQVSAALLGSAIKLKGSKDLREVAIIAANDVKIGELVAEALERVGQTGIVTVEYGTTVETLLEVVDGMSFDRGYLSHHMVTDIERMQVVLDRPYILMTDLKLSTRDEVSAIRAVLGETSRPLLIIAEEVAPACVISLLSEQEKGGPRVAAIHPPDYGHWRKSMLEDLAIVTGGRVIARDLGGSIEQITPRDLGTARQVRISANQTVISAGGGDPLAITARRQQVQRQVELAPPNIERDKLEERLARLSGGSAIILAGGATPVEQRRHAQLIEDSINAARAAAEAGVVAGGGTALVQIAPQLSVLIDQLAGSERMGAAMLRSALEQPLAAIAANCGLESVAVVARVKDAGLGYGLDARSGEIVDMLAAGIIDPVKVSMTALRNAASIAGLILTTQTLIAKKPDQTDPSAGPALGGGAEKLGRA
ncbi:MAG: chaperonin GroEL [Acetobacteraceae bacterium]|jgi:chaperonin GroEL|nr:chaperonin GroEL [Acetobacteraceae bacterium]